ncbi:MAG: hypothetical protein HQ495_15855, partial [Alphaproteobacteria bacterium]|nr:hypothetical protein [Alphaproteobacteria bacterium]
HEAHLQRMQQRTLDMLMALQGLRDGVDPVTATKANARAQAKPTAIEAAVQAAVAAKEDERVEEIAGMSADEFRTQLSGMLEELGELTGGEQAYRLTAANPPATDPDTGDDSGNGSGDGNGSGSGAASS